MERIRRCSDRDRRAVLAVVNAARSGERHMERAELEHQVLDGVEFWGYEHGDRLVAVMAIQTVADVEVIRHAWVVPAAQRQGIGTRLLKHLRRLSAKRMLVGISATAASTIAFYQRHGFERVSDDETSALLTTYWEMPDRPTESSVVLAHTA